MAYASSQIAPEKLMLGLAFYGYVWNTTSGGARSLDFDDAAALAATYQSDIELDEETKSATFSFQTPDGKLPQSRQMHASTGHTITRRGSGACPAVSPTVTTPPSTSRAPVPGVEQQHVVWLEEARSAAARLNLVDKYGLSGIGAWRLGQEDSAIWPLIDEWKSSH
jgi:spore germination protein YaaH